MPASHLLGLDLGSSSVKAVLLEPERGIVARGSVPVAQHSPHPGWAEAFAEDWWDAVVDLVPRLLAEAGIGAADVAAVAATGMVPAFLPVDAKGRPLRRAMLQNDARAIAEIRELRDALSGLDLLHLAGGVLSQQSVAPSALWTARHEPRVWAEATAICGSYDWLARRLGAEPHVELNWALESTLYALDLSPIRAVTEATGLTFPAFLPVRRPGEVVGEVSAAAAVATGLAAGTPIVVGGADHVLSAYGAGLVEPGECLIKLGGAGDIMTVSAEAVFDERLYLDHHPIPGRWMPNGCMAATGSLLRWEQSLLGGADLAELDAEAAGAEPGALLALPYFLGEKSPLHDPELRGVLLGLTLATSRGDVHRSLLESTAYGFRRHLDVFAAGRPLDHHDVRQRRRVALGAVARGARVGHEPRRRHHRRAPGVELRRRGRRRGRRRPHRRLDLRRGAPRHAARSRRRPRATSRATTSGTASSSSSPTRRRRSPTR